MTAVGMRLEINGLDVDGWTATLVDLEANVEWFDAAGPDPLTAASRLLEVVGTAYSAEAAKLTAARVHLEAVYDEASGGRIPPVELDPDLLDEIADLLERPRIAGVVPGSLADQMTRPRRRRS